MCVLINRRCHGICLEKIEIEKSWLLGDAMEGDEKESRRIKIISMGAAETGKVLP